MSEPRPLRILAAEPYAALSHRRFLEGLQAHSRHRIEPDLLPARKWKWRLRTASLHHARRVREGGAWDLIFASDFVNLAELLAILPPARRGLPAVLYFHENQLTYPLQENEERDYHFALTHLHGMLAARRVIFNSEYHRRVFLAALGELLRLVPDVDLDGVLSDVESRSGVLPLGTELDRGVLRKPTGPPRILWNHRWEYDKNPRAFVDGLRSLAAEGIDFRLLVVGERFRVQPEELVRLPELFPGKVEVHGFQPDREVYLEVLARADVVASTADHEFFGLSTLEALRSGCLPVLPDDLAYPELIPSGARRTALYPRGQFLPALRRAVAAAIADDWRHERRAILEHTDRFAWRTLAPRYDEVFEKAAAPE